MTSAPKPTLALTLLVLLLCFFNIAEASPAGDRGGSGRGDSGRGDGGDRGDRGDKRPRSSSVYHTPTSTSCTPTATATKPATLAFNHNPIGYPGDNTELQFGPGWNYVACIHYQSNSCAGDCVSPCCNKGLCGTVQNTDLLLSPVDVPLYITPRAPAVGFTFFDVTFTSADFGKWPSITVELGGIYVDGTILASKSFIIPKPSYGQFYSSVKKNLPIDLGLGSTKRLDFSIYYTGSEGKGGFGPQKRIPAQARLDSDGTGAGIKYETYTPLGCEGSGGNYKRDEGVSFLPNILLRRSAVAGDEWVNY